MIPLRDTIPSSSYPFVTVGLITLNVLAFFYELSLGRELELFIFRYGAVPLRFFAADVSIVERLFPLFTSMFLHGGWVHLLGNMLYLWIFGDNIEDRLGHARFLLFYLLCGLAAALAQIYLNPTSRIPMVGASGAIAGVLGGYLLLFPHSRVLALVPVFFFLHFIEIPAFVFLIFWFLMQFLSGAASIAPTQETVGGVAWWAHIGGFVSGLALAYVFPKRKRQVWSW
ncbi:MAG TPA: rhomboid family intramembrane serine protease [Alphaproteobacteria bacterium]|nr:rhomboid family intramembrane serine protease [Alphaproteobacteria bacterium]